MSTKAYKGGISLKTFICLLLCAFMLSGCSGKNDLSDRAVALRSKLQAAHGCSFDASVTADYGDKTYTFAMGCRVDAHGNLSFTVEQPETIQGITGHISKDGGKLTFDDKVLAFYLLADEQLSPVSGPWVIMQAMRGGYIVSCSKDRITLHDSYREDAFTVDVQIGGDGLPQSGEIYWQNRRIMGIQIKNFTLS
jgi:hypothetical protein